MLLELLAVKEINKPPEIPQPKPQQTIKVEKKKETKPKKIYYTVKKNDTIVKISKRFKVPVSRVLCANKQLDNPDLIHPSERLRIPHKKDKLKCARIKKETVANVRLSKPLVNSGGFSVAGNMYEPGQCTWHVKNNLSWVGNDWGDASQWSYNASLDGYATHATPRVGAVAWRSGHVGYVLDVKAGQVLISEMNYDWIPYHQRNIWVDVSSYQYIY